MRYLVLSLVGALAFTLPANAQDSASEKSWQAYDYKIKFLGVYQPSEEEESRRFTGDAMDAKSANGHWVQFFCVGDKLRITVATKPGNPREDLFNRLSFSKFLYVDYALDGGKKKGLGQWAYVNGSGIAQGTKRSHATKIYNAVIRRQTVTLYVEGRKSFDLDLPAPNADFSTFGANCGLGINAKK